MKNKLIQKTQTGMTLICPPKKESPAQHHNYTTSRKNIL